jgi:hypothetical protein
MSAIDILPVQGDGQLWSAPDWTGFAPIAFGCERAGNFVSRRIMWRYPRRSRVGMTFLRHFKRVMHKA